ncbi:hypothetical protein [Crateriforma conspicua]|uniref:Dihydroorotate dehydrogenase 2 n=1 Tax=Crateriforma conspicua TaxID=2527996 RepID=A0A5C6FS75_9PLAN|nr:hypothetical protein [Crateriforma conspicua]TWU63363.1 hypothetical protein V7x_51030 [Crateriforma conspicua]
MTAALLDPLHLLPPPTTQPWDALRNQSPARRIRRADGSVVNMPLPLFWYAPDWYLYPLEVSRHLAAAVAQMGVCVAALRSEVAGGDHPSPLHDEAMPRLVPYRPERYGFQCTDFDDAQFVDLRLTLVREPSGRFAFPPAQVARWESDSGKETISGGGWVEAASFPPDVADLMHLGSKIVQIRTLSPSAAVMVSINPIDLDNELPAILDADPDGIILRADRFHLTGIQLAKLIQKTRRIIDDRHSATLPLWIVPGPITADDAAKLIALGASAVAIDAWCQPLREEDFRPPASAAARLGFTDNKTPSAQSHIDAIAATHLRASIERFTGMLLSTLDGSVSERLGTFDQAWAETLGVRFLG